MPFPLLKLVYCPHEVMSTSQCNTKTVCPHFKQICSENIPLSNTAMSLCVAGLISLTVQGNPNIAGRKGMEMKL